MGIEEVEAKLLALAKEYDPTQFHTLVRDDPFKGTFTQSNRMRAFCQVNVNGEDITYKLDPHLISVRIVDGDHFQCEIEIDDRDAMLPIPPILGSCSVALGWAREQMIKVFDGVILEVEYGVGRKQGGRRMWVHANGWNTLSTRIKEPMNMNLGEGAPPGKQEGDKHSLQDWVQKVVKHGGGSADVASKFAANMQDYWGVMSGSPLHEITSLGQKFGAMTKWDSGNVLRFEVPGQRGISCYAVWKNNLIGCRIRPFTARSSYGSTMAETFNNKDGQWLKKTITNIAKGQGPAASAAAGGGGPGPEATQSGADNATQGAADGDAANRGTGRIVINGEPSARWNSYVVLQGVRPGVDGQYLITTAEHIYSRQGYVTWLDVEPDAKAKGADSVLGNWPLPRPNPNIG
jgi:uncharacterized protein